MRVWGRALPSGADHSSAASMPSAARAWRSRCGRCKQAARVGAAPDGVVAARAQ